MTSDLRHSLTVTPDGSFLITEKNGDVLVDIHVVPNASRTQAMGLHGEAGHLALRLRLHAPPVDGKANQALIKWLASCLGISATVVTLVSGQTSRRKRLRVRAEAVALARWKTLLALVENSSS